MYLLNCIKRFFSQARVQTLTLFWNTEALSEDSVAAYLATLPGINWTDMVIVHPIAKQLVDSVREHHRFAVLGHDYKENLRLQ